MSRTACNRKQPALLSASGCFPIRFYLSSFFFPEKIRELQRIPIFHKSGYRVTLRPRCPLNHARRLNPFIPLCSHFLFRPHIPDPCLIIKIFCIRVFYLFQPPVRLPSYRFRHAVRNVPSHPQSFPHSLRLPCFPRNLFPLYFYGFPPPYAMRDTCDADSANAHFSLFPDS